MPDLAVFHLQYLNSGIAKLCKRMIELTVKCKI